jgi:nucleotide-binding universal stress UspA family protein
MATNKREVIMEPIVWQRILVATDLSELANNAVHYAHRLAEGINAELHVLYVARSVEEMVDRLPVTGVVDPATPPDEQTEWLAGLLGERGSIRRVEAVRVGSDVAHTIVQYAVKTGIDLIVMATHGRTGLSHLLMGSVTESVLHEAPCPVLVLRG